MLLFNTRNDPSVRTWAALQVNLDKTRLQFAKGYIDRMTLIVAEQSYRQTLLNLAQAQAMRLGDTASLFQALGGGWWNTPGSATTASNTQPK